MFKKNLYSFCALIALSCSAYAMLEDVSSLGEGKGDRNALRAPTASLSIDGQEPSEASSSSPASSVSSSLFPNDDAKQLSAELERLRTESEECGRLYAQLHLKHIAQDRELAVKKDEAKQLAAELEKLRTESEECGRLYAQLHLKHIAQDRELSVKEEEAKQLAAELEKLRAGSEELKAQQQKDAEWYVAELAKLRAEQEEAAKWFVVERAKFRAEVEELKAQQQKDTE